MIVDRIGDHPDIEKVVFNWICDRQLDAKRSVHMSDIRDQVRDFIAKNPKPEYLTFKMSDGWIQKFMQRYHLVLRNQEKRAQEKKMTKSVKAKEIIQHLENLNQNLFDYESSCILQMDETGPTYVDMSDDYTIDIKV